jgi:PAS domain-containing protein
MSQQNQAQDRRKQVVSRKSAGLLRAQKPLELILARNLIANISAPAFLADNRATLVFYNEAAGALLGVPFEQAGNMDREEWAARFGPFDGAGERIPVEEVPLTIALREVRPVHAPLYIHSATGQVHHIEVTAIPLASNEEATGAIGIFWPAKEASSTTEVEP